MKKIVLIASLLFSIISCTQRVKNPPNSSDNKPSQVIKKLILSGNDTLVADFEANGMQANRPFDGYTYIYTDSADGGKSSGEISITSESNQGALGSMGCFILNANVTKDCGDDGGKYGFIGCGINFCDKGMSLAIDSLFKGFSFYAKGKAGYFVVKLQSSKITDSKFHETSFLLTQNWKKYDILFSKLIQPRNPIQPVLLEAALKDAIGIQWQSSPQIISKFDLSIDNIELIKK